MIMNEPCACPKCVRACTHIPGIYTPVQAMLAVKRGYAMKMMAVHVWELPEYPESKGWPILMPLSIASSADGLQSLMNMVGELAKAFSDADTPDSTLYFRDCAASAKGRCVNLGAGLCMVHGTTLKPKECQEVYACDKIKGQYRDSDEHNKAARRAWLEPLGRLAISRWKDEMVRLGHRNLGYISP